MTDFIYTLLTSPAKTSNDIQIKISLKQRNYKEQLTGIYISMIDNNPLNFWLNFKLSL